VKEERQLTLADYADQVESDRRHAEQANRRRQERRAFIVFATDPERMGEDDYKLTFTCEAKTQAEAEGKVRRITGGKRRVAAYLASGKYKSELPEARWVA
jgi:hypothetical protein